ncbi:hypothetical protein HK102_003637 [Quaeritorhiza haematococci]|nr:hypothetical protein HK102_003637 [Quaeritorhiza haematococci]
MNNINSPASPPKTVSTLKPSKETTDEHHGVMGIPEIPPASVYHHQPHSLHVLSIAAECNYTTLISERDGVERKDSNLTREDDEIRHGEEDGGVEEDGLAVGGAGTDGVERERGEKRDGVEGSGLNEGNENGGGDVMEEDDDHGDGDDVEGGGKHNAKMGDEAMSTTTTTRTRKSGAGTNDSCTSYSASGSRKRKAVRERSASPALPVAGEEEDVVTVAVVEERQKIKKVHLGAGEGEKTRNTRSSSRARSSKSPQKTTTQQQKEKTAQHAEKGKSRTESGPQKPNSGAAATTTNNTSKTATNTAGGTGAHSMPSLRSPRDPRIVTMQQVPISTQPRPPMLLINPFVSMASGAGPSPISPGVPGVPMMPFMRPQMVAASPSGPGNPGNLPPFGAPFILVPAFGPMPPTTNGQPGVKGSGNTNVIFRPPTPMLSPVFIGPPPTSSTTSPNMSGFPSPVGVGVPPFPIQMPFASMVGGPSHTPCIIGAGPQTQRVVTVNGPKEAGKTTDLSRIGVGVNVVGGVSGVPQFLPAQSMMPFPHILVPMHMPSMMPSLVPVGAAAPIPKKPSSSSSAAAAAGQRKVNVDSLPSPDTPTVDASLEERMRDDSNPATMLLSAASFIDNNSSL